MPSIHVDMPSTHACCICIEDCSQPDEISYANRKHSLEKNMIVYERHYSLDYLYSALVKARFTSRGDI